MVGYLERGSGRHSDMAMQFVSLSGPAALIGTEYGVRPVFMLAGASDNRSGLWTQPSVLSGT